MVPLNYPLRTLGFAWVAVCALAVPAHAATLPVTSNLILWLDADAANVTKDGSNIVSTWLDKTNVGPGSSDNTTANSFTQGTLGRRPVWTASATPTGMPVLTFDGTDDSLTSPDDNNFDPDSPAGGSLSVFVVGRFHPPSSTTNFLISKGNGVTGNNGWSLFNNVTRIGTGGPSASQIAFETGAKPVDEFFILSMIVDNSIDTVFGFQTRDIGGVQSELDLDPGASGNTWSTGTIANANPMLIGVRDSGNLFLDGDMAEVLIYRSALSTADRNAVETYLFSKHLNAEAAAAVPEPATFLLLLPLAAAMFLRRYRFRAKA